MKSKNKSDPSGLHVAGGGDEDYGDGGRVAMEDEDDFFLSLEHFLLWVMGLMNFCCLMMFFFSGFVL